MGWIFIQVWLHPVPMSTVAYRCSTTTLLAHQTLVLEVRTQGGMALFARLQLLPYFERQRIHHMYFSIRICLYLACLMAFAYRLLARMRPPRILMIMKV